MTLLVPTIDTKVDETITVKGVRFDTARISRSSNLSFRKFPLHHYLNELCLLLSISRAERFDVIYLSKADVISVIMGVLAAKITKLPLVLDVDDYETSFGTVRKVIKEKFMKIIIGKADAVVASSNSLFVYCKSMRQIKGKVFHVSNSSSLTLAAAQSENDLKRPYQCLLAGPLFGPHLDYVTALQGLSLTTTNCRMLIIGDGPDASRVKQTVKDLGLESRVEFAGWLDPDAYARALRSVEFAVWPSYDTMFERCKCPARLFDYLALGIPIIAVGMGEHTYVVNRSSCGLTVQRNPVALARALDFAVRNQRKMSEMGTAGTKFLSEHYSWETMGGRLEAALTSVIGG